MNILYKSGSVLAVLIVVGCGGGSEGDDEAAGSGGSESGSCDEDALRAAAESYCGASEALWGEVDCEYQPCTEQNFDGLIAAVQSNGCGCELVAFYDCESARFSNETAADCSCGGSVVECPDDDLCAVEKMAFDSCLSP
jgi:hypothetical protein